jgi:hypothetical protein
MSGGGGGGEWRPDPIQPRIKSDGDQGGGQPDVCNISEVTNLNSVDPKALITIGVGTVLQVRYAPGPPMRLLAETGQGSTVGSITSPSMPQLIQCIQAGRSYVAEVQALRGGICRVEVRLA